MGLAVRAGPIHRSGGPITVVERPGARKGCECCAVLDKSFAARPANRPRIKPSNRARSI